MPITLYRKAIPRARHEMISSTLATADAVSPSLGKKTGIKPLTKACYFRHRHLLVATFPFSQIGLAAPTGATTLEASSASYRMNLGFETLGARSS